jgi:hypothetical protein
MTVSLPNCLPAKSSGLGPRFIFRTDFLAPRLMVEQAQTIAQDGKCLAEQIALPKLFFYER